MATVSVLDGAFMMMERLEQKALKAVYDTIYKRIGNKDYVDINLPYEAADNYYNLKTNKRIDEFIYLEKQWYTKIFEPTTFFILGPKGSGKTLFAAYMCAKKRSRTKSKSYSLDVGDYGKLIRMKNDNHLQYTDYSTMWKVILLQKFLFGIMNDKRKALKGIDVISNNILYNITDDSFNPVTYIDSIEKQEEVSNYLEDQGSIEAKNQLLSTSYNISGKNAERAQNTANQKKEQVSSICKDVWNRSIHELTKSIEALPIKNNHYLFVDGLDVRPSDIDTKEYSECIGALIRAVYDINISIFGNMLGKRKKSLKIVALTRTDIFLNSHIINATNLIHDNCIEFDWTCINEKEIKNSYLYKMMNRVLGWKRGNKEYLFDRNNSFMATLTNSIFGWDEKDKACPVEHYFNFDIKNRHNKQIDATTYIMRLSRLRPRDLIVIFNRIQEECKKQGVNNPNGNVLESSSFRNNYSHYYADQIKSELQFRYTESEVDTILNLTKMIRLRSFSEKVIIRMFDINAERKRLLETVFDSYKDFLNVLYSLNIIGWTEASANKKIKVHWCYRESRINAEDMVLPWGKITSKKQVFFVVHECVGREIIGID